MKKVSGLVVPSIALFFIILLGLFLRSYNLNSLPIFADEAIYVRWSQVMKAEPTLRFLPLSDGKQPLFMWAMMPFLKLISDPLIAGRLLSILSGMASLVGIYLLANLLLKSKKAAVIAALFYAISPYTLFFDRMALVDSMLAMFGVWTLLLTIYSVKTRRFDFAMLAGFALGGAFLTKSPALFIAILIPFTVLFIELPKKGSEKIIHLIKVGFNWLTTLVIGYGMYNILRLGPNFHMLSQRNQDYIFPISHLWTNPKDPFLPFFDRAFEWIRIMGPNLILVLLLAGSLMLLKKHRRSAIFLLVWFLMPIMIQAEFARVFTARYILMSIPPIFILSSGAIFIKGFVPKKLVMVFILAVMVLALRNDYILITSPENANLPRSERSGYLEEWTAGTGIKEVSEYIKAEHDREPDKQIIVGTEGYFGTLPDGLQIYLNNVPNVVVIGIGLDIGEVRDSLRESVAAGNKTYMVANSSRLKFDGDFENYGLKVIEAYKKADRPEGIREYVQHGVYDTFYLFEVTPKALVVDQEI